ncbi:MAG: patatin-like phospholipase family protein [Anaerolineales bacterium]|nr:patatin-like phospholipase family protein [Anaerolineales bacterium]
MNPKEEIPQVTLALGGGGVKCYTQIGVLRALAREGFQIRGLAGTSAGGIVATLYAAGFSPEEIQRFHEGLNIRQLLKRMPGEGPGLLGLKRGREAFRKLLGERTFADLKFPLVLTSVDLMTGQAHLLNEGPVLDALMIAVAIPGLFPPTPRGEKVLLDGGALHPVPVAAARALAPAYPVVAVALFPPYAEWDRHPFPNLLQSVPILRHIARWRLVKAFNIYVRTMDITQRMLAELRLEVDQPDVIIRPQVDHLGLFDPVNIDEVVKVGEVATQAILAQLRQTSINFPQTGLQYPVTHSTSSLIRHVP